ncbi:endolytic transglycosylase MltG [Streptococcus sp. H31]|uniref:endolytic transglycosylase MltG n=1 Tax=Streptococcus huangxiaojuni TaxID=3237239 RepID=UPI0034A4D5A5
MTDFKDDKQDSQDLKHFKEKLLAELEEANQLRKQQEEALAQKEAAEKDSVPSESTDRTVQGPLFSAKEKREASLKEAANQQPTADDISFNNHSLQASESTGQLSDADTATSEKLSVGDAKADLDNDEQPESATPKNKRTGKQRKTAGRRRRQKTDKLAKRIARVLILAIVLLLAAFIFFAYRYVADGIAPVDKKSTEYVTVEIPEGSGNKYIGQILENAGLIKNATIFNYYTKFKNYSNFQSGYYNLQKSMDLDEISQILQESGTAEPQEPALGKILVTEGYTIEQIATAVTKNTAGEKKSTPFKKDDFLALVKDEKFISRMTEKYPELLANLPSADKAVYQLEGYLFPATYNYYDETTLEELVEEMIATTNAYMSDYYSAIEAKGMTVNEVLTLASLVEKEGATDEDRRNIASVFYNRLEADMALQSNIAVQYALGTLGEKTSLKDDATIDTKVDSPYNDYTNTGLMPGPVDSPSLSAIEATVNPADTKYLYFVADVTTGEVYFAENFEEHEANVEKYINSKLDDSSSSSSSDN